MLQVTDTISKKKAIVNFFITKNILINSTILEKLNDEKTVSRIYETINTENTSNAQIQNNLSDLLKQDQEQQNLKIGQEKQEKVKVIFDYLDKNKKKSYQDFVGLFHSRFKQIEKMLQTRQELQNLSSINRLTQRKEEKISIIGMVLDKQLTKNENIMLVLEDDTGIIKAVITKSKQELYTQAKDIVLDEVIGLSGALGENIIFANAIVFPDIPLVHEFKKAADEACALILSDVHIGSNYFLEEEFKKFISWIKGETGTEEQIAIAKKVKYLFVVGDLVDGVGIYPNQEKELKIKDIYQQYAAFSKEIQQVPQRIQIIISTGNHDAVRLAEPQPKITKELCPEIWQMPNVTIVGNPAIVNIHSSDEFPGFDVLMYHGYSYDHYSDVVESIKISGRHISDRNDLIMKFLLQKRHLAPTYGSTPYLPDGTCDPLVIEKIPDIFLSGHVHKSTVGSYRGVQIVSGSCFQAKTAFQEKVGHEPEPCRVPLIDLKTRQVKMLRFDIQKETLDSKGEQK